MPGITTKIKIAIETFMEPGKNYSLKEIRAHIVEKFGNDFKDSQLTCAIDQLVKAGIIKRVKYATYCINLTASEKALRQEQREQTGVVGTGLASDFVDVLKKTKKNLIDLTENRVYHRLSELDYIALGEILSLTKEIDKIRNGLKTA